LGKILFTVKYLAQNLGIFLKVGIAVSEGVEVRLKV
jgi:hypothetical protein